MREREGGNKKDTNKKLDLSHDRRRDNEAEAKKKNKTYILGQLLLKILM
jgi:hypothetical protein